MRCYVCEQIFKRGDALEALINGPTGETVYLHQDCYLSVAEAQDRHQKTVKEQEIKIAYEK